MVGLGLAAGFTVLLASHGLKKTTHISASLDIRQELPVISCRSSRGVKMPPPTDLLQGTLDLLILKTLALEPMHGWGISARIQQVSRDALKVGQGSLYPALHRLKYNGWTKAEWASSENNRRAKFYHSRALVRSNWTLSYISGVNWPKAVTLVLGQV